MASRALSLIGTLACAAVLLLWAFGGGLDGLVSAPGPASDKPRPTGLRDAGTPDPSERPTVRSDPGERAGPYEQVGSLVLKSLLGLVGVLAAGAGGYATWRLRKRRRRLYRSYRLVPGRSDHTSLTEVDGLLAAVIRVIQARWDRRLSRGQPSVALEYVKGPTAVELLVTLPDDGSVQTVEGALRAVYRDARLEPCPRRVGGEPVVVRLKKRHEFVRRLKTAERETASAVGPVLSVLQAQSGTVLVQLVITPAAGWLSRYARWELRQTEDRQAQRSRGGKDGAGMSSEVAESEIEGGLRIAHRALAFCEIRVAAGHAEAAKAVAGAISGATRAENELVERWMHNPGRLRLYQQRVTRALGNPLASWMHGVYSTAELAVLWGLPSPFDDQLKVRRSALPNVPPPPEIRRVDDREEALATHGREQLALHPGDLYANLALLGQPGGGKTSLMVASALSDVRDADKALICLDAKGDLVDALLGRLPADRRVHHIDLGSPEAGINPFEMPGASIHQKAAGFVSMMKAITEDRQAGGNQIGFSSDRYLRQGALAILSAESEPTVWHVWRLLLSSDEAYREHIANAIREIPGLEQTHIFLSTELPFQLTRSASNFITRLDAPANKAIRLTTGQLDVVLRHPFSLDIDQVIRDRDVLLIAGAAGQVETDDVAVLMQLVLVMVHNALLRQQQLPQPDRARVALKIDEAHLGAFSDKLAELLALGRTAGLEATLAFQSPSQIPEPSLRERIFDMLSSWCIFAISERSARELAGQLQVVYSDSHRDDPESHARQRISTDALIHMPRHHFAAAWRAHGARTLPFVAQTIPMPDAIPGRREELLQTQRDRGAMLLTPQTIASSYRAIAGEHATLADDNIEVAIEPPPAAAEASASGGAGTTTGRVGDSPTSERPAPATMAEGPKATPGPTAAAEVSSQQAVAPSPAEEQQRPLVPARKHHPDGKPGTIIDKQRLETWNQLAQYDQAKTVRWTERRPDRKPGPPSERDAFILAMLLELKVLSAGLIAKRLGVGERSTRNYCRSLIERGWLRSGQLRGGTTRLPLVYGLTEPGARALMGRHPSLRPFGGSPPAKDWERPRLEDATRLVHDLRSAAWVLAFEPLAAPLLDAIQGPVRGGSRPPRWRQPNGPDRNAIVQMPLQAIAQAFLASGQTFDGISDQDVAGIAPDMTLRFAVAQPDGAVRYEHMLVELEHSRPPSGLRSKLRRYDAFITGWARSVEPYKTTRTLPSVVFVLPSERHAFETCKIADEIVTGQIATIGKQRGQWQPIARPRMLFAVERDAHQASLRAYRSPLLPLQVRRAVEGHDRSRFYPEVRPIIKPETLERARHKR